MGIEIVIGIVCLVVGAGIAYAVLAGQSNSKVKTAQAQVESAQLEADRITTEAAHQAETAKKEAVLEAKEQVLAIKQASEAEEKKRKGELQSMESRIMQREESLDRRNEALDRRDRGVRDARVRVAVTGAEVLGRLVERVEREAGGEVQRRRAAAHGLVDLDRLQLTGREAEVGGGGRAAEHASC